MRTGVGGWLRVVGGYVRAEAVTAVRAGSEDGRGQDWQTYVVLADGSGYAVAELSAEQVVELLGAPGREAS